VTLSTRDRRQVKRCRQARVWLNGVEVTNRCFYVDGRRGVVRLYKHDAGGHVYANEAKDGIATEELHGRVKIGRVA
jgi:hypothetical protein